MSKKIAAVQHLHMGHLHVEFEDGSMKVFQRGDWEDKSLKVGEYYPPLEKADAVEQGDGQVESGNAPVRQQEGAASQEPGSSGSDHAVGEEGRKEGQKGVSA